MTTDSPNNPAPVPAPVLLPGQPRDDDGPVFAEPWQAQAFAMAVRLHEQGHFTWTEWAATLSEQIAAADAVASGAGTADYYEHWLATLEAMVTSAGLADAAELSNRKHAWQRAAETTPHGQPIALANAPGN